MPGVFALRGRAMNTPEGAGLNHLSIVLTVWDERPSFLVSFKSTAKKDRCKGAIKIPQQGNFHPRQQSSQNRRMAAAQVKPAPKVTSPTVSPGLMRPLRRASSRAMGIEAAEVLPYRSTLT